MHEGVDAESPDVKWMRWWVQNDARHMYYLARMPDLPPANGVAVDYFWTVAIVGIGLLNQVIRLAPIPTIHSFSLTQSRTASY
jgi:hypothetical protein